MATSGKKNKKKRGETLGLRQFLGDTAQEKIVWADDVETEEFSRRGPQMISLPTGPRASRYFSDDSIPHQPPYQAHVTNLPFDLGEADIYEFFEGLKIESIRLPREDGDSGRLRGFGYIKFETKEDLIEALRMPEPQIRNRRIRIDYAPDNDNRHGGGSNWRQRNENNDGEGGERGNRRGTNFRDRERDQNQTVDDGASWRTGERPKDSPPSQRRNNYGGDSYNRRRGYNEDKNRNDNRENDPPQERQRLVLQPRTLPIDPLPPPPVEEKEEVIVKRDPVPSAKIFGDAKPVDTTARDREIEERLEKERQALLAAAKENEEAEDGDDESNEKAVVEKPPEGVSSWRTKSDHNGDSTQSPPPIRRYSPAGEFRDRNDRRGPPRRDDDRRSDRDDRRGGDRDDRRGGDRDDRRGDDRRGGDRRNDYRPPRDNRDFQRNDRDNRSKDFRDKDRDYNRDRTNNDRDRYSQKKNHGDNRGSGNRNDNLDRRDNRTANKPSREITEDRMPKYQPPTGPNIELTDKFALLDVDDGLSE